MEMSVKAGGNATTIEQPKDRPSGDRRNASQKLYVRRDTHMRAPDGPGAANVAT